MQRIAKILVIIMLVVISSSFCSVGISGPSYYDKAKAELKVSNFKQGVKYMNKFIRRFPSDTAYEFRSNLKLYNKDRKGALKDLNKALSLTKRDSAKLLLYRAQWDLMDSNAEKAILDNEAALKINPACGGYFELGEIMLGRKKYSQAVSYFNKQIDLKLDFSSFSYYPYSQRGIAKYYLQDLSGALADLDSSLHYEPGCGWCYKYRAQVKFGLGLKEEACDDYKKASDWGFTKFDSLINQYCKNK